MNQALRKILGVTLLLWGSSPLIASTADTILWNGKILQGSDQTEALAVIGEEIVAVGQNKEVLALKGPKTTVINLDGQLVIPGFTEGHGHLVGLGRKSMRLDFTATRSEEAIAEMVGKDARNREPDEWIQGRGWDQNEWAVPEFPDHSLLSTVAPQNPVYLVRVDGHAAWVNKLAMEKAGITKETPNPEGGRIVRDSQGHPTGVLIDRAMGLVRRKIPPMGPEETRRAVLNGMVLAAEKGITSFHDAGVGADTVALYEQLHKEKRLLIRLNVMLYGGDQDLLQKYFAKGPQVTADNKLTIRSVKLMVDGALGSRGAALLEDYSDEPGHRGLLILKEEEIFQTAKQALAAGYQVAAHGIGDHANRVILNAFERAFATQKDSDDHRFRVEHAQIIDAQDIPRFGKLGIIASMQGIHCTSDMGWVPERLGDSRSQEGAYPWQKLIKSGATIVNGSDAPVEPVDPLLGFYASITRQTKAGLPSGGWYPDQRMNRQQALASFTSAAAYATFQEGQLGTLQPGMLADLVVLSKDIMNIEPKEILDTKVNLTMVGGKIVHRRQNVASR